MRYLLFLPLRLLTLLFTSGHLERTLRQLSSSIIPAINPAHDRHRFIPHVLRDLVLLERRPHYLAGMAYEWCSLICENNQDYVDRESLLLSLEIGFRHLDPQLRWAQDVGLTHTEHHQGLVDVVFESNDGEAIADLLHAWTLGGWRHAPAHALLRICAGHLVDLHNRVAFSSRLRGLIIRSVELIGYGGFEGVGMGKFVELLNYLHVTVEDIIDHRRAAAGDTVVHYRISKWMRLFSDALRSPVEILHLSHWYWELLVELAISLPRWPPRDLVYDPQVLTSLVEADEWDKLECWIGTIWIIWPPEVGAITEDDLGRLMQLLSRQRPGAIQKLTQWMEQWSKKSGKEVPKSFERICKQVHKAAQQGLP